MSKFRGNVTITKTWTEVEVDADDETAADTLLLKMSEAELNNASANVPDEDTEVTDVECVEDCPEEEPE